MSNSKTASDAIIAKRIAYGFIAVVLIGLGLMIYVNNKPAPDSPYKTISIGGVVTLDIPCDDGGTVTNTIQRTEYTSLMSSCLAYQTVSTSLNVDLANTGYDFNQGTAGRSYARYSDGLDGTNANGEYYSIASDKTRAYVFASDNSARLSITLEGSKPIIDIERVVKSVDFR